MSLIQASPYHAKGHLCCGAGGAAAASGPSALIHEGQEVQELSFMLISFHISYLLKGHYLAM